MSEATSALWVLLIGVAIVFAVAIHASAHRLLLAACWPQGVKHCPKKRLA
jgi:hypothetical protein